MNPHKQWWLCDPWVVLSHWQVGDRVVGLKNFGAWSDVVVLPSSDCNVIPDNMSLEDAAAIPVNYLTSYLMLFDQAALKPGDKVFVHMAAGMSISSCFYIKVNIWISCSESHEAIVTKEWIYMNKWLHDSCLPYSIEDTTLYFLKIVTFY